MGRIAATASKRSAAPDVPAPSQKRRRPTEEWSPLKSWLDDRYAKGLMSAVDVCTCAWHCKGACLGVDDLAMDPVARGSNHMRHLEGALGLSAFVTNLHRIKVPTHNKKQEVVQRITIFTEVPATTMAGAFLNSIKKDSKARAEAVAACDRVGHVWL